MALASSVSSLSPAWFPVPSFQIPVLSSTVGFLSPFPDSLPQLFLRCLPYAFAFGLSPSASLSFVRSTSGSGYSASVSSFPLSSRPRLSAACPVRPLRFRFPGFPRSFQPGFPCLLSRLFVLGFLSVSFRPSLIRSHSRSSGAYLLLSLSVFPLPLRFLSSASLPVLATQPLFLPFLSLPVLASQRLVRCALPLSLPWPSPFLPTWFPVSSLPVLRTRLSVSFLSPLPDSLPQPFLRCLPLALAFGLSPSAPLSFVRVPSGSCYSASVSSFPLSSRPRLTVACSVLPLRLSASLLFRFRSARFPVLRFRFFVLGFLFVSFHPTRFRSHSRSTGASLPSASSRPLPVRAFPSLRFLSSAAARF